MSALEKWGRGRDPLLTMFSHEVALGADAIFELCDMGRDARFREGMSRIEDKRAWFSNYKHSLMIFPVPSLARSVLKAWMCCVWRIWRFVSNTFGYSTLQITFGGNCSETASKREERKAFKEMLTYTQEHARELAGVLFYKVDRATRNIFDYVEVARLESEYGVPVTYVARPTENNPAGRMQRRILSSMATFYTEQQSVDVREGMARRVQSGYFVGKAPYGYRNVRRDGRGIIETHPEQAAIVRRIFELYAYQHHTIDSVGEA